MRRSQAGFSLLEVITVVSIIGVVAAISIPNFIERIYDARAVQADVLVQAIVHRVHVAIEEGRPITSCGPTPAEIPGKSAVVFTPDRCWRELGFTPAYKVGYQLKLDVENGAHFRVSATGDIDEDGVPQVVSMHARSLRPARQGGRR